MKMSLVVPCYNEEEAIPIFYREALKVIEQWNIAVLQRSAGKG